MASPTILNVSEGRIQNTVPDVSYYDRSTAHVEFSRNPDGTEFYLAQPTWAECTDDNVKRKTLAHFHPTHPTKTVRVRDILMVWQPPQSSRPGRTFVYVTYDVLDASNTWQEMKSGGHQMIIEFAFAQLV
jgi:hypothetical protein